MREVNWYDNTITGKIQNPLFLVDFTTVYIYCTGQLGHEIKIRNSFYHQTILPSNKRSERYKISSVHQLGKTGKSIFAQVMNKFENMQAD